ncbi:shikimate kinase [Hymenobacter oligotrophus]|uniref:Shikimate kinase n=1 Tax=Hymenobacter oligotrophus TaxID=2319843 RepID=A0A3B7RAC7_9BACT|nr:shikimate kinase [Hymenobacter oligotrophus]AYA37719.1 shikimate kinase [Hymenobacter oligotrophus]
MNSELERALGAPLPQAAKDPAAASQPAPEPAPATPRPATAPAGQFSIQHSAFRIHLIGMPGAGKTTLGRALAARYGLPFRDLDEEIVQRQGRSVQDIFAADGEDYFRQAEADALRAVLAEHPRLVLATGGGTPCFHGNAEELNRTGLTLWLDVPVAELLARLQHAAATRPLLAALPDAAALEQRLQQTLAARERFYATAHLRCTHPACTPETVHHLLTRFRHTA